MRVRLCLRQAVCSIKYSEWLSSIKDKQEKERAEYIADLVNNDNNFTLLGNLVKALRPVYKLLRMVDSYTPAVGIVYAQSLKVDTQLAALATADGADAWCEPVHNFWVRQWGYMHVDLHSLGYCVNPQYHSEMDDMPADVWTDFIRCATRMLKAAPESANMSIAKLTCEYSQYHNLEGCFSHEIIELARTQAPHLWW